MQFVKAPKAFVTACLAIHGETLLNDRAVRCYLPLYTLGESIPIGQFPHQEGEAVLAD